MNGSNTLSRADTVSNALYGKPFAELGQLPADRPWTRDDLSFEQRQVMKVLSGKVLPIHNGKVITGFTLPAWKARQLNKGKVIA